MNRLCFGAILLTGLAVPFIGCGTSKLDVIQITPSAQTLDAGQTVQFTAGGIYGHGNHPSTTQDVTSLVSWTSSAQAVATVSPSGLATAVSAGTTTISATMKGFTGMISATATLTVTAAGGGGGSTSAEPLVSLTVFPSAQTALVINEKASYFAFGTTSSGASVDLTNKTAKVGNATIQPASWVSTIPSVGTVGAVTGIATAIATGSTTITATAKNPDGTVVSGSATLTVNISSPGAGEPLVSLALVPGTQTLSAANQNAAFIAIGTTSSGTTVDLTHQPATIGSATIKAAAWSSSSPGVATINAATGVATAVSNGTTVITALASNPDGTVVTGTATLTVNIAANSEPLVSLAIVPGTQTATAINQTAQFIAIGTTSLGNTVNLTDQSASIVGANGAITIKPVVWASSSSAVATVNSATGVAKAVGAGVVAITAVATNPDGTVVTAASTLTVSTKPEPLVSLTVVPAVQTVLQTGQSAQFIAIGTTASGATVNLTGVPASIDAATNLTATTIQPAIWKSSTGAVATIDSTTGLATAGMPGTTVITAMVSNPDGTVVTGTATLTINGNPEPLVSLSVTPANQQVLAINQTAKFIAIANTSGGTTVNLTGQGATVGVTNPANILPASWHSSNPAVADVDPATGIATAYSAGTTAITAIAMNPDDSVVTGSAVLTVTIPSVAEPLASLAILPSSQTLAVLNQPAYLKAIATTGTGTTVDLTGQSANVAGKTIAAAVWNSSNENVATVIKGTGEVTAISAGTTAITAIASNPDDTVVTGIALVTVTATGGPGGTLAAITVLPGEQGVSWPGATAQFTAIGTTTTGATRDLTQQVKWQSSSNQIASILDSGTPNPGQATAVSQGTATITAAYNDATTGNRVTGVATFTVVNGTSQKYTALTIIPNTLSISASGQTAQLVALATLGNSGFQQDVTSSVHWISSSPNPDPNTPPVAGVSQTGLVTGQSVGNATITAELINPGDNTIVSATSNVTVTLTPPPNPLLSLNIIPISLSVGDLQDTGQFLAIGTFSTAPYVQDLTNSPNTTWISSFPDSFPVNTNSGGTSSASAGIVTAYGTGSATIIAEYQDPTTKSIQTATATFSCPLVIPDPHHSPPIAGSCYGGQTGPLKATLTVYGEGLNTKDWLITAPSATSTPDVIHCGPGWTANGGTGGSVCTGIYPVGTTIILKATGGAFGGWTKNCIPVNSDGSVNPTPVLTEAGPNYCKVSLTPQSQTAPPDFPQGYVGSENATVGAIFNNPVP